MLGLFNTAADLEAGGGRSFPATRPGTALPLAPIESAEPAPVRAAVVSPPLAEPSSSTAATAVVEEPELAPRRQLFLRQPRPVVVDALPVTASASGTSGRSTGIDDLDLAPLVPEEEPKKRGNSALWVGLGVLGAAALGGLAVAMWRSGK